MSTQIYTQDQLSDLNNFFASYENQAKPQEKRVTQTNILENGQALVFWSETRSTQIMVVVNIVDENQVTAFVQIDGSELRELDPYLSDIKTLLS